MMSPRRNTAQIKKRDAGPRLPCREQLSPERRRVKGQQAGAFQKRQAVTPWTDPLRLRLLQETNYVAPTSSKPTKSADPTITNCDTVPRSSWLLLQKSNRVNGTYELLQKLNESFTTSDLTNITNFQQNSANISSSLIPAEEADVLSSPNSTSSPNASSFWVQAGVCTCSPLRQQTTYCPSTASTCRVRYPNLYRANLEIDCVSQTPHFWVRYVLPLAVFLFIFVGYLFWASPKGRYARCYGRKLLYRWSDARYQQELELEWERMFQRLLRRQEQAARLRQRAASSGREGGRVYLTPASLQEDPIWTRAALLAVQTRYGRPAATPALPAGWEGPRMAVVLRIKRYGRPPAHLESSSSSSHHPLPGSADPTDALRHFAPIDNAAAPHLMGSSSPVTHDHLSADNTDEDHGGEEKVSCAICLHDFKEGDRVGDLPCQHLFHVNCLKNWIRRQNFCPLCKAQAGDATTHHTAPTDTGVDSTAADTSTPAALLAAATSPVLVPTVHADRPSHHISSIASSSSSSDDLDHDSSRESVTDGNMESSTSFSEEPRIC